MIFSKPTSYAIRALVYLAQNRQNGSALASEIAEAEQLPPPFLSKLLRELSSSGIVTAVRGRGGGFALAKSPELISLHDIFLLYDGLTLTQECLLGLGLCSDETACCVHRHLKQTKNEIEQFLKSTSIADLLLMRDDQRTEMIKSVSKRQQ